MICTCEIDPEAACREHPTMVSLRRRVGQLEAKLAKYQTGPRGEPMPQTIEQLQALVVRDAEHDLEQQAIISKLRAKVNKLEQARASQ